MDKADALDERSGPSCAVRLRCSGANGLLPGETASPMSESESPIAASGWPTNESCWRNQREGNVAGWYRERLERADAREGRAEAGVAREQANVDREMAATERQQGYN